MEHQTSIGRWFKSGSKDFCAEISYAGFTWHGQKESLELYPPSEQMDFHPILDSIVVSISACHVEGPGSIPGRGVLFSVPNTTASRGDKFSLVQNLPGPGLMKKIWLLGGSNP